MTMPASPRGDPRHRTGALGLGHRSGQQLDAGGVRGAAEHAAGGEVAEHRGDRAVVLLGEHLGGREQRRLPAGVDHAQHRAQRHQGLAGADLALEQPVHRVRLRRGRARSRRPPRAAPRSARTAAARRTPPAGRRSPPVRAWAPWARQHPAAPGQHQLGDQRLLEPEPPLGAGASRRRSFGSWIRRSAVRTSSRSYCSRTAAGTTSGTSSSTVSANVTARWRSQESTPLVRRVDRVELTDRVERELRGVLVLVAEEHDLRVGQLPRAAEACGPCRGRCRAGRPAAAACVPLRDALVLGEERHPQRRPVGAHGDLEPVRRPAGAPVLVGA